MANFLRQLRAILGLERPHEREIRIAMAEAAGLGPSASWGSIRRENRRTGAIVALLLGSQVRDALVTPVLAEVRALREDLAAVAGHTAAIRIEIADVAGRMFEIQAISAIRNAAPDLDQVQIDKLHRLFVLGASRTVDARKDRRAFDREYMAIATTTTDAPPDEEDLRWH